MTFENDMPEFHLGVMQQGQEPGKGTRAGLELRVSGTLFTHLGAAGARHALVMKPRRRAGSDAQRTGPTGHTFPGLAEVDSGSGPPPLPIVPSRPLQHEGRPPTRSVADSGALGGTHTGSISRQGPQEVCGSARSAGRTDDHISPPTDRAAQPIGYWIWLTFPATRYPCANSSNAQEWVDSPGG